LTFSFGGHGGGGGDGGTVSVFSTGNLSTTGATSAAIFAQSIGGGGGNGGTSTSEQATLSMGLTFGGTGGGGGNAAAVTVQPSGNITTTGLVSPGILAQSVGGSGGLFQGSDMKISTVFSEPPVPNLQLSSSVGGGGAISVGDTASEMMAVSTSGNGSHGIVAQSVGAGGGMALMPFDTNFSFAPMGVLGQDPSVVKNSISGLVSVNLYGTVSTTGVNAYGILAMSRNNSVAVLDTQGVTLLEGEAIKGVISRGQNGGVSINVNNGATIATSGSGSDGIRAYGLSSNSGAVSVNINGSVTTSGSGAWGVSTYNEPGSTIFPNGTPTQITVGSSGMIKASGSVGGAIRTEDTGATLNNSGTIIGNINFSNSISALTTVANVTNLGQIVGDITITNGAPSSLTNTSGVITGSVSGPWLYSLFGGTHRLSYSFNNPASNQTLNVSSISGLAGSVAPYLIDMPGKSSFTPTVLVTSGSPFDAGLFLTNTLATNYQYSYLQLGGLYQLSLTSAQVDFTKASLTGNYAQIAKLVNSNLASLEANSSLQSVLVSAANATKVSDLQQQLDILNTDKHYLSAQSAMTAATAQLNSMHSCTDFSANNSAIAQNECAWAKAEFWDYNMRGGDHKQRSQILSIGRQTQAASNWYAGFSAGLEHFDQDGFSSHSDGHVIHVGAIAKYVNDNYFGTVSGVLGYRYADATRVLGGQIATADQSSITLASRLSSGYLFNMGSFDLIPRVELDLAVIQDRGYQETGAGSLNLKMHPETHFLADLHPVLRLNHNFKHDGLPSQVYAEVGARYALNNPSYDVSLPNSAHPEETMRITSKREDVLGTVAAGVNWQTKEGMEVKLMYQGDFNSATTNHSASFKANWKF
jgi:hypothetical protein